MPFICLANSNIPSGVLQITDLWPNVSQRNQVLDPPGQNRYLRRPGSDLISVDQQSGNVVGFRQHANKAVFEGLGAYLLDRVEPGALQAATATVTIANVAAGDEVVIKGFVFQFFDNAGAGNDLVGRAGSALDPFLVERESGIGVYAGNNQVATNLANAINDPGTVQAAMDAVAPLNHHAVAVANAADVDITVEDGVGAVLGSNGDFSLTVTDPATTVVTPVAAATKERLVRTNESWGDANVSLDAAVTAIQNRVDNGQALTLAAVNTALNTAVGADLDGSNASSNSTGTLAELLSILAGRQYQVPAAGNKFTAATAPDTVHVWSATQRGSFTSPNTVFGTQMLSGEWGPSTDADGNGIADRWLKYGKEKRSTTVGGDTENNEIGGVRSTYDGTHFQASVQNGQLSQLANGITLFPDQDVQARVAPSMLSKQSRQATLSNQRIVTVYDDDGTLLV